MPKSLRVICLTIAVFAATPALCDPGPPPGAADVRAFRECQDTQVKKLDDGKRDEQAVAKDLAVHCEKQYEAMSAAVLKMFGKPVWMSNYDSSLAAVRANRNPNSELNQQKPGH
jgi:hypothetical protein